MKRDLRIAWIQSGLLALAVLFIARWCETAVSAHAFQTDGQRLFDRARREPGSFGARARTDADSSGIVGRIVIPRIGLRAMIGEGTSPRMLERGVGHVRGTAFPGESGVVGLAGHRDTFFRGLGRLRRGDLIRLGTLDGDYSYRVVSACVVGPRRTDLLRDHRGADLALVTCYPFHVIGPAPDRYVVRARRVTSTVASIASVRGRAISGRSGSPLVRSIRQGSTIDSDRATFNPWR